MQIVNQCTRWYLAKDFVNHKNVEFKKWFIIGHLPTHFGSYMAQQSLDKFSLIYCTLGELATIFMNG